MKIYSMTATFGKLEHETLNLNPGFNLITAPNEWGKSTWCAFLAAMFYGLDTRSKSTKNALADKERFAPWSGAPMAGRIDLNWKGRDITIQRSTRRRVPLGEFRAYETASGLPVEELTAANCGEMLLGVEQSVFRRAGFIRFSDLPVTQDEALRRRLNALVTTGDESGAADKLADSLRELKNRCRYNRTGLLPQAEQERREIEEKLARLEMLESQTEELKTRLTEIARDQELLRNHKAALEFAQAETVSAQAFQAEQERDQAKRVLYDLEIACTGLPSQEEARQKLAEVRIFREEWKEAQSQAGEMPRMPEAPNPGGPFEGLTADEAREMIQKDGKLYGELTTSRIPILLLLIGAAGLLSAAMLALMKVYLFGAAAGVVALIALAWGLYEQMNGKKQMEALVKKYGTADVTYWTDSIRAYEEACRRYEEEMDALSRSRSDADMRLMMLRRRKETLCGDREPDVMADYWQKVLSTHEAFQNAHRECQRAESHLEAIRSMVRQTEKPAMPDVLTCSETETAQRLESCEREQQRLQNLLGQHQGAMASLGDRAVLRAELEQKNHRIAKLERTYGALILAQETLEEARRSLQRRFAPRITKRAQELMTAMTEGRYHSLSMGEDFSLLAGAGQEDVLHEALWRSDGTIDQLYLSLRLAVAEELTPEAPLILDDALVRFDDGRMAAAVSLLQEMAEEKQIICFTCQNREKALLNR